MGFLHRASRCDRRGSRHQPLCRGSRRSRFEGIELVDNGAWISAVYLIGEIIVIALTDYLSRVFSFRIYAHVLGIERRGAICGGRDIGRYAVDLGAPGLKGLNTSTAVRGSRMCI